MAVGIEPGTHVKMDGPVAPGYPVYHTISVTLTIFTYFLQLVERLILLCQKCIFLYNN